MQTSCLWPSRLKTCWSSIWPMRSWSCSQPRRRKSNTWSTPSSVRSKRYGGRARAHAHTHTHSGFLLNATNKGLNRKPRQAVNDVLAWPCWKSSCLLFSLQDSDYVIAERNFVTEDHSMLRFHKGDIIRLQVMDGLEKGETLYYLWPESCNLLIKSVIKDWARLRVSRSFRFQLRLRGEEDGCVFGGDEKRYFGLWWGLVDPFYWCFSFQRNPSGQRIDGASKEITVKSFLFALNSQEKYSL